MWKQLEREKRMEGRDDQAHIPRYDDVQLQGVSLYDDPAHDT